MNGALTLPVPAAALARHPGWLVLAALVLLPAIAHAFGLEYYVGFARRVLIVGIAVFSLGFLLGVGGMPSLGHAGFVGVGAYTAISLVEAGLHSFWGLALAAICAAAVAAGLIGLVSLRTRGTYFIMITLAFAQMLYYLAVSLRSFGGDDGYTLTTRPHLGLGLDADHGVTWYFVVLAVFVLVFMLLERCTHARFGRALAGIRENEVRMGVIGYRTLAIQLAAFVLTGAIAGLAGFLLLVDNRFFSPVTMHWTNSAMLLVMVVLGGSARLWGAALGAAVWLVAEEIIRQHTTYWHWPLGLGLILVTLFAPRGLSQLRLWRPR
jgi:branched-chain amino acid transport system permease protein